MSISTALFDLDDTLIDSSMAIDSAIDLVFKSVGIQHLSGSEFSRSVRVRGGQLAEAFHALEVEEGVRIDLLHLYRSAYWNKAPGLVKLYPGVKDVLTQLHRSGIKLGIVTQKNWILDLDGFPVGASKELEELGIIELFSTGVGFENVVRYKPDPEGVLLALSTLNSNAENSSDFKEDKSQQLLSTVIFEGKLPLKKESKNFWNNRKRKWLRLFKRR